MTKTFKAALILTITILGAAYAQKNTGNSPRYTKDGEFVLPQEFRNWSYLSSSVAMSYAQEGPGGHAMFGNLFVQPSAREQFEKTGAWPDKTVLLMELRGVGTGAKADTFLNKEAQFQTNDVMGYEAHVKDTARGGWDFYFIRKGNASGKAIEKTANCFSCHADHAAVDTTFVQYYPTLIDAAKAHGTWKEPKH